MTTETTEPTVRPSAAWYLLVLALWAAAIAIVVTVIVSIVNVVDDGVTPVGRGGAPISDSGITIYASVKPDSRDCVLIGTDGQQTPMNALSYDLNATFNGTQLWAVASSPDGLPAGLYAVRCPGLRSSAQLWYGDRFPLGSIVIRSVVALGLGLIGAALLVALLVMRHNSKSRLRAWRLMAASAYAGGYPGQPGWAPGPPVPYSPPPSSSPYGQQPYGPPPGYGQPPGYGPPPGSGQPPPTGEPPPNDGTSSP